jgi:signal transduction histidine kinase
VDTVPAAPGTERPSERLSSLAQWLESRGQEQAAEETRRVNESLDAWEAALARRAAAPLAAHHDIRNALTGVLGNAQLLLMGPAAEVPGVRKRLESLTREAERIRDMADALARARVELMGTADRAQAPAEPAANGEAGS